MKMDISPVYEHDDADHNRQDTDPVGDNIISDDHHEKFRFTADIDRRHFRLPAINRLDLYRHRLIRITGTQIHKIPHLSRRSTKWVGTLVQ